MRTQMCWPEIFTNKNFEYPYQDKFSARLRSAAVADGLSGWACCEAGAKPPENFGKGMVKIKKIIGTATPDGLMAIANGLLKR